MKLPLTWLAMLAGTLALTACGTHPAGDFVLIANSCAPVDTALPRVVSVVPPAAGALRLEVRERGVTVSVRVDRRRAGGPPLEVASPVERSAWHVLLVPVAAGEPLAVRVLSRDAAPAGGSACLSAVLLADDRAGGNGERAAAAAALSAAGTAVAVRDWPRARSAYAAAARRLDAAGRPADAARARLALATLDVGQAGYEIDALALASAARSGLAGAHLVAGDPTLYANLLVVEASARIAIYGSGASAAVPRLLAAARRSVRGTPGEARELPRLDTLEGYWRFVGGDRTAATAAFELASQRCAALRDPECEARARQNLGAIEMRAGHPERADAEYQRALAILPATAEPALAADIDDNLSLLRGSLGLYSSSEGLALEAMRLHAVAADCEGARRSLDGIGLLLAQVGDTDTARRYLHRALDSCPGLLAGIRSGDADRVRHVGGATDAATAAGCALPDTTSITEESAAGMARAIVALATLDLDAADVSAARRCIGSAAALEALPPSRLRLALASADIDLAAGDVRRALARLGAAERDAAALKLPPEHLLRRQLELEFARALLDARRPQEAWARANHALRSGAARSDPGQFLEALRIAAESLRQAGMPTEAVALLRAGTALATRIPVTALGPEAGATFVATQHALFSDLTDLLAREGEDLAALDAAESGRARAALAALARSRRNETGEAEPDGAAALVALRSGLADRLRANPGTGELAAADAAILTRQLEAALAAGGTPGRGIADEPGLRGSELTGFLARLGTDGTVVEYATAGPDLIAFVIRGPALRTVRLGSRAEIARRAGRLLALLQDPDTPPAVFASAAARLAERIWWPLALEPSPSIVLVPEDALSDVPFAALPWSAGSGDEPVLEHARTSVIPSLRYSMARAPRAAPAAGAEFVVVGEPIFSVAEWRRRCGTTTATQAAAGATDAPGAMPSWTERLAPLPGAAAEASDIMTLTAQYRHDARTLPLLECAATASRLRGLAGRPLALLHLATHARIDAERPRLSALALTPEWEGETLHATLGYAEIVGMQLQVRLVVLGACDTSRGQVLVGEGVLGPAQAFLQGGAASVIGTLWSIDDRLTAEFMARLYRHLLVGHLPIGEALRQSQLDFRHDPNRADSHFWAAFTIYGEAGSTI